MSNRAKRGLTPSNERQAKIDELFPLPAPAPGANDALPSALSVEALLREFVDAELVEDSPWQPPYRIDVANLGGMVNSLNSNGQLAAALVRPHPLREGRFQSSDGHRRKYAIIAGANPAPPEVPFEERHRFLGKIWVVVRDLTDEQMVTAAVESNEERDDFTFFDRAWMLLKTQEVSIGAVPGKPLSFEELEASGKLKMTARAAYRIVATLKLPAELQRALMEINLAPDEANIVRPNEKHARAMLELQPAGQDYSNATPNANQKRLLSVIKRDKISGNEALKQVQQLRARLPEPHNQAAVDAYKQAQDEIAKQQRVAAREANTTALTEGKSHLRAVDLNEAAPATPVATQQGTGFDQRASDAPEQLSRSDRDSLAQALRHTTPSGTTPSQEITSSDFQNISDELAILENNMNYFRRLAQGLKITPQERAGLLDRINGLTGRLGAIEAVLRQ